MRAAGGQGVPRVDSGRGFLGRTPTALAVGAALNATAMSPQSPASSRSQRISRDNRARRANRPSIANGRAPGDGAIGGIRVVQLKYVSATGAIAENERGCARPQLVP